MRWRAKSANAKYSGSPGSSRQYSTNSRHWLSKLGQTSNINGIISVFVITMPA